MIVISAALASNIAFIIIKYIPSHVTPNKQEQYLATVIMIYDHPHFDKLRVDPDRQKEAPHHHGLCLICEKYLDI
jgi:hypothetical protein